MDIRPQRIVDLANTGQVVAAEQLMAETAFRRGLSGQDQQTCEHAIAKAQERMTAEERLPKRRRKKN